MESYFALAPTLSQPPISIAELLLLPYADDSVFFDSGLNADGVKQASGLYQTLEKGYKGSDHEAEFKVTAVNNPTPGIKVSFW